MANGETEAGGVQLTHGHVASRWRRWLQLKLVSRPAQCSLG